MPVVSVDNCGQIGLLLDQYKQEMAPNAWSEAKNFVFREGYAERASGHLTAYGTPSVPPYYVSNLLTVNGNYWLYAGLAKLYSIDADKVHANITRQSVGVDVDYTGDVYNKWNGGALSGIAILNNGIDVPQFWPGTGRAADLTNWPSDYRCKVIRPFRNYLLALNVTKGVNQYPHLIKWSHAADPGTIPSSWDITDATKDAGEYDLADDETELLDGLSLGEQFILYKGDAYYSAQYIGSPFVFRFQRISSVYGGVLATNCVTSFPGGHFVVGRGDVYVHQGGAPESVIDARNRKWLFRQLDAVTQQRSFTCANPVKNELWVCFPQSGDEFCNLALIWNWKENTWGVRELPGAIYADVGSIDYTNPTLWDGQGDDWQSVGVSWTQNVSTLPVISTLMASPQDTKLYGIELGAKFDTQGYEAYVSRDNIRFDKPNTVKLVKQVRPLIEGPVGGTIDIFLSAAYDQTADPTWFGPYQFRIGVDQKIDCHVVGRMMGVKFVSTEAFPWRLKRYDLMVQEIGEY